MKAWIRYWIICGIVALVGWAERKRLIEFCCGGVTKYCNQELWVQPINLKGFRYFK